MIVLVPSAVTVTHMIAIPRNDIDIGNGGSDGSLTIVILMVVGMRPGAIAVIEIMVGGGAGFAVIRGGRNGRAGNIGNTLNNSNGANGHSNHISGGDVPAML